MGTSDNSIYKLRRSAEGMRSTVRSDKNMGQLTRTHIHTHTLTHIHIHSHIYTYTYTYTHTHTAHMSELSPHVF